MLCYVRSRYAWLFQVMSGFNRLDQDRSRWVSLGEVRTGCFRLGEISSG